MGVEVITVTRGTAITAFCAFTKPTRASYPTVKMVPADPTTVQFVWRWTGGTETTWTYGLGTQVAKLDVGTYVATIPTKTSGGSRIEGKVVGAGLLTAVGQFSITVNSTTT